VPLDPIRVVIIMSASRDIFDWSRTMIINRRAFSAAMVVGTTASLASTRGMAAKPAPTKARNVVLVHGLFADGSCWSEVIGRLQAAGLNATAVQNPLTTLPEAVASALRVLARQDGPTVLVGHSRDRGGYASERLGTCLCGGTGAGCG
jgi:pimeloyl-ACP methyl ester carboxylesterase